MYQTALITGATKGIGLAIAQTLAQRGYDLMLMARSQPDLAALQAALKQQYPAQTISIFAGDVRQWEAIEACVQQAKTDLGRLDVLVNNAGIATKTQLLQEQSIEAIDATIDTNLKGPIYLMKAVIPLMVNQGGGMIININSIAGKEAFPYWSTYCASKFGLTAMTDAVRDEQRQNNIKLVSVFPGAVDTPIWKGLEPDLNPDHTQMIKPQSIADAVVYLLDQPAEVMVQDLMLTPQHPVI